MMLSSENENLMLKGTPIDLTLGGKASNQEDKLQEEEHHNSLVEAVIFKGVKSGKVVTAIETDLTKDQIEVLIEVVIGLVILEGKLRKIIQKGTDA